MTVNSALDRSAQRLKVVKKQSLRLMNRDSGACVVFIGDIFYDTFEQQADIYLDISKEQVDAIVDDPGLWVLGWGNEAYPVLLALRYPSTDITAVISCRMPARRFYS